MITWNATRNQASYDAYLNSVTYMATGVNMYGQTNGTQAYTEVTSQGDGQSVYINNYYESFTNGVIVSEDNQTIQNLIGTSITDGTVITSYTQTVGVGLVTTTETTQEYDFTITSTYTATASQYTSATTTASTTSTSASWITTAITSAVTTAVGDYTQTITSSADDGGSPFTSSEVISITSVTDTTVQIFGPVDIGTVISAQNEWLFSFTVSPSIGMADFSTYFITDIAESFTVQTLWPAITTIIQLFFDSSSSFTFSNPDSTTAISYEFSTVLTDTSSTTVTYGDYFPRSTSSVSYNLATISTATLSAGVYGDGGDTAFGTSLSTFAQGIYSTTDNTILMPVGLDWTTTTITNTVYTSSSYQSIIGIYNTSDSYDTNGSFGQTVSSTSTEYIGITYTNVATQMRVFQPIPEQGGFRSPNELSIGEAANFSFSPAIYYPFTASVVQNIVSPVPTNTSLYQTDATKTANSTITDGTSTYTAVINTDITSWNYSWGFPVLSWTSATSHTYTTSTFTETFTSWDSTSSTVSFATVSEITDEFFQIGETASLQDYNGYDHFYSIVGGYAAVTTQQGIANMQGGFQEYTYDTSSSESANTLFDDLANASVSQTVQLEIPNQAFNIYTQGGGGGGISPAIVSFTR